MRTLIAAAMHRALALAVEAKRLRRLEIRDLIGLGLIAAGLILLILRPAR
jgi:uncharacterized membrane protein